MDAKISKVIEKLSAASTKENSREIMVPPSERMSSITYDTGMFLNILLRASKAKHVLEIGMSVGFSTIWMAEAIRDTSGTITTIELEQKKVERATNNFKDAGVLEIIDIQHGIALDILQKMTKSNKYNAYFDFVLLDADKENMSNYFDIILPMVQRGGIIVTDNMIHPTKFSNMMNVFAKHVRKCTKVRSVLIPIGNGEELTIKL